MEEPQSRRPQVTPMSEPPVDRSPTARGETIADFDDPDELDTGEGRAILDELVEVARQEGELAVQTAGRTAGDLVVRAVLLSWDRALERRDGDGRARDLELPPKEGGAKDAEVEALAARRAAEEVASLERWLFATAAGATSHPLASRLALAKGLAGQDEAALEAALHALLGGAAGRDASPARGDRGDRTVEQAGYGSPDHTEPDGEGFASRGESERGERAELALWLAEAWQLGLDRAPPLAAMELLVASEGPHALTLARLSGRVPASIVRALADAVGPDGAADQRAEAACLLLDSGGDPEAALRLSHRAADADLATRLRAVELAIEAGLRGARGADLAALWRERAQLVGQLSDGALEAAVSQALAIESEPSPMGSPVPSRATTARGEPDGAITDGAGGDAVAQPRHAALAALSEAPAVADPHFGPLYLRMRALVHALAAGEIVAAAALRERLSAESPCPEVSACHAARAALSLEAAGVPDRQRVYQLAQLAAERLATPSLAALRDRAWLRLPPDTAAAIALLATRGDSGLRWAAHLTERKLRDLPRATTLWERVAQSSSGPHGFALEHLASCHRRAGAPLALLGAYDALADRDAPRPSAVWRLAAGALELSRGELSAARTRLEQAAEASSRDPVSRIGLLRLLTRDGDWPAAARMLEEVLPRLSAPPVHRRYTRELAILFHEHLDRADEAERAFEQILAEDPLDAATLVALGALYEHRDKPMLAIAAKQRAADLLPGRADKVRLLLEVAALAAKHNEPEESRAALEQAQLLEPGNVEVQRLLAGLYEQLGQDDRAVAALRAELGHPLEPARRIEVQLRLAALLTRLDLEPESVVATYLEILSVEPTHAEALAAIQAPARALGWWDALVRAFRNAPATAENLEILAEALDTMASWAELARVRQVQLEAATDRAEQLQRAVALASLYEVQLGDADAAVRMLRYARKLATGAERARLWTRIEELLEKRGRASELVELYRQQLTELAAGESAPSERRLAMHLKVARILSEQLGDIDGAVAACEAVLHLVPAPPSPELATPLARETALALLETLHQQRSDHTSLTRVLLARASSTELSARGAVLGRLAQVHASHNELDLAITTYQSAIEAAPADREIFTAYERLCYGELRWDDALRLYDVAIAHVEAGALRAYRLSDLYARKAQVQSQYLEDLDGAAASLTKLIALDGNPEAGAAALEEICASRGDYAPLVTAFERRAAATRDPGRRIDAYRRAALLAETHLDAPERVAELRKQILVLDPSDTPSGEVLEAFYRDRKDSAGLIALLQLQLSGTRDQGAMIALLQRIAEVSEEEARDVDGAISHYLKILELEPGHLESLEALGRIYESTERWVELIDVTRRQIRGMADRNSKSLLYFRCGSVMEAKFGREEEAIRYYEAAIKVSPACMPAIHGLRDLYRRRKDWPRVIETLELEVKIWQEDKERAGVLAQIGHIYSENLGDGAQAMRWLEEALTIDPDCLPANWALFEHHFANAQWEEALPVASALGARAMRDGEPTTRSEFYRKRGVVSLHTGDPRVAADSFVVALEIRPTNLEALEALGALARAEPEAYDFETTYRELERVYRRRDDAAPLLARVWLGLAAVAEHAGDLDAATELCAAAAELVPADFSVLSSVVDFHCDMRRWSDAVSAIEAFLPQAAPADRTRALLRQAEIHGDGELDALRAIAVLREVLRTEPTCHEAYYALAQQYFLHSRFAEARTAMDRAIDLATSPDAGSNVSVLARYYYYKGRILEAAGDSRSGAAQYRRAIEHDPAYAPPALLLSHRAAESGDQRTAESLLIEAARAAISQGGNVAAVPLQRGLARILLATGERAAAIEAYRGILAVTPDNASDRVALAEIYAVEDLPRAIAELRKVIELDIHHAPAYRLLASFYARTGETERAGRVLAALDLLGFAEDTDRSTAGRLRTVRLETPLVRALDLDHRYHLLATRAMRDVLGELWSALAEDITALFPQPSFGMNLVPMAEYGDAGLEADYLTVARIFETTAEVFVGDHVPGMVAASAFPRQIIAIDRSLCGEGFPARRFLFGWALDAIRGGYAMLLNLGAAQRRELTQLLRALVANERDRTGAAVELVRNASPRGAKVIERYAGRVRDLDVGGWIDGMQANAKRSGLLACDDFSAAIWMIARLSGESLHSHHAMVALGAVLGGSDLVRYYLSDDYQRLRDILTTPATVG